MFASARACVRLVRFSSQKASAENVKALRAQTSLSIALCRKALDASSNNIEAAVKWLNENEQARAEFVSVTIG